MGRGLAGTSCTSSRMAVSAKGSTAGSAVTSVMRSAMSKLFREEDDVKQLIKLRTIYELLELITDRCEDVANIIEGIVLENS